MIIKGRKLKKLKQEQAPASGLSPAAEEALETVDLPVEPAFTAETLDQGLVKNRRLDERRRSYRRMEDKDLIRSANEEARQIKEDAKKNGYEDGLKQAVTDLEDLTKTFASLMNAQEDALNSVADDLAGLAVEIAERVIKTEVSCDDTLITALVRDTIQKVGRKTKTVLVKVHPDNSQALKHSLKDAPIQNLQAEISVMDDPTVDPGGCIVETNSGLIDSSFSTQLEILRKLFGATKKTNQTESAEIQQELTDGSA